jgi:hypothetical protein
MNTHTNTKFRLPVEAWRVAAVEVI